jgi:hypothetical protein
MQHRRVPLLLAVLLCLTAAAAVSASAAAGTACDHPPALKGRILGCKVPAAVGQECSFTCASR